MIDNAYWNVKLCSGIHGHQTQQIYNVDEKVNHLVNISFRVFLCLPEAKLNQSRQHMFIISVRDGSTYSKTVNCFNTIVKREEPGFN